MGWKLILKAALLAAMFGLAMAIRDEVANTWLRAAIAGVAGVFFGWLLIIAISHRRSSSGS